MPRLDKTGPMGQGCMSGGKRGRCNTTADTKIDSAESQPIANENVNYGQGRGGAPRGGAGPGRGGTPRGGAGLGNSKANSLRSAACRNGMGRRYGCQL